MTYTPGPALDARANEAEALLGERKAEVDRVLDLLAPLSTHKCGLLATAYAAWNDLLIAGEHPTDRDIIRDVRHHWHKTKEAVADKDWFWALRWLEANRLLPQGRGRPVLPSP